MGAWPRVEELQAELAADLLAAGARVTGRLWTINALLVEADAEAIRSIEDDPRVARIALDGGDLDEAINRGEEIRQASQITQFLDNGFDGSQGSGRTAVDTIYVAVVDDKVDIDHPAWDDCGLSSCGSRLLRQEEWSDDTGGGWVEDPVGMGGGDGQHGMRVAGQLLADLTDGQDIHYASSTERLARTGMTTETTFVAIDKNPPSSIDRGLDRGIELNVDIMNLSAGCSNCTKCDLLHTRNKQANVAYHEGVFFTKGAGNDGHDRFCEVLPPGLAAGAFVVAGSDYEAADLTTAGIYSTSSRGGDSAGRAVIDVTAPAGRSSGLAEFNNTYSSTPRGGTSYAAPIAAGAAANLKHQLIDHSGAAIANKVGNIHALMLLMGDGQLEGGGTASTTTPVDELWGTGRLRMRMWEPEGMDAPYGFFWVKRVLAVGDTTSVLLNPDEYGVNQDVPADVDWFKAAVWWYEPNVNYPSGAGAELRTRVCNEDTSTCHVHGTTNADAHRLWLDSSVAGHPWRIDVTGVSIPANLDPNDYYGQQKRAVYIAFYWEDRARDDADGPDTGIQ